MCAINVGKTQKNEFMKYMLKESVNVHRHLRLIFTIIGFSELCTNNYVRKPQKDTSEISLVFPFMMTLDRYC